MRTTLLALTACSFLVLGACSEDEPGGGGGTGGSATGGRGGSAGTGGTGGSTGGTGGSTGGTGGSTGGTGGSTGGTGGGTGGTGGSTGGTGGSTGGTGGSTGGTGGSTGGTGGSAGDGGARDGGSDTSAVPVPGAPCPRCVKIFNGVDFTGWEAHSSTWSIVGGAMRGIGGSSRAAYTKEDYGNVRLIVTSRMNPVNGDHLGILFWGNRPTKTDAPEIDRAGWLQWMPPSGTMWSYHPPMHHHQPAMKIANAPATNNQWHTSELLLNLDKGTLRVAVNGVETTRYTHQWPTERVDPTKRIIKGPLAFMRHGRGGSEYKDVWVEVDPDDKLVTVK